MLATLSILFAQLWLSIGSLMSKRTRTVLIVAFVLLLVFVLTLVPQVTVWACPATGYCPCPGC